MKTSVYLFGIGNNTPVYIELAYNCGYKILGIYHYNSKKKGEMIYDIPIIGSYETFFTNNPVGKICVPTMGDIKIRCALADRIRKSGAIIPTLIHSSAIVSSLATIEDGVTIHALAVVHPMVEIKRDSVISTQAAVIHNAKVGRGCYIAVQACVGAYSVLDDFVFLGMCAALVAGKAKKIGKYAVIGAGSVVLSDIADGATFCGNPAKLLIK